MRPIDILINVIYEFSNNGYKIEGENQLIDIIYELIQKGIDIPYRNWTICHNGVTSQNLLNDIHKLKFFKLITEDEKGISITLENEEFINNVVNERNKELIANIVKKIPSLLKK
ncbi:MAG: hypothetical protein ACTSRS_18865 [Candidatus Helarchaeota archaeon]